MRCAECKYKRFGEDKGGVNRYYCTHPTAAASVNASARLIARTKRHETELTIKSLLVYPKKPIYFPQKTDEACE